MSMLKRDIADKLYSQAVKRYSEESPDLELTRELLDAMWFSIYGVVCKDGEEAAVGYITSAKLLDVSSLFRKEKREYGY